ncbi:MAG: hypothetical protein COB15_09500 [Flavobacteriales bacterium]|nr:MAG: hypothetical protein COB15_09500 [Flavobacteriales bacterium]
MKKLKGWSKLTLQVAVLSTSMMLISFFTESQIWLEYFNFEVPAGSCNYSHNYGHHDLPAHSHWNYRGWVYFLTGLAFFIMSLIRIRLSHETEDFK